MRIWNLTLAMLLLALMFATQPAKAQSTVVITNCSNDSQLRSAATAPGNSQISFNCGAGQHTITITGSKIEIQGNVVIHGAGTITLDGNNSSTIFQVFSAASLELRNLTVQRGSTNVTALENFGKLTIDAVILKQNQSTGDGGAISSSGILIVRNSSFVNNSAVSNLVSSKSGGAIFGSAGTISISNTSFNTNKVQGTIGTGGAISLDSTKLYLSNSQFNGNSAPDGGAIWLSNTSTAAITNTLFLNNQGRYAGAIESNGELDIDHSLFVNNQATVGDGGALWITGSDADIGFSTFRNNQAKTTGGAISCYANTISVINSTLNGNSAEDHGAAIYSSCNVNLTNSTLSGNTTTQGGGGIYQTGSGTASIQQVTIANNKALFGAGIYNDGAATSTLNISTSLLNDNLPDDCGGVITSGGDNLSGDTTCGAFTQTGDKKDQNLPLGTLRNNGGPTFTHMPLPGNPAMNAIPAARCGFSSDQRLGTRPFANNCDVGAVEVGAVLPQVYLPINMK